MPDAALAAVLGALVVGILLGERLGPGGATASLLVAIGLALVAAARRRRGGLVLALAAALIGGTALTQRALDGLAHSPLAVAVEERADAVLGATLVEDPDGSRFFSRVLVRADELTLPGRPTHDAGGRTVFVVAEGDAGPRLRLLGAGDRVTLRGWLRPLDGFDTRYRWRHAVGRFDALELVDFEASREPLNVAANALRALVLRGMAPLPATPRGIVSGFLLGDVRDLPEPVVDQFRAAGLSHLLVVSGANVAFVLALVGPALRRLPNRARLTAGLGVLVVFGAMTRWEPSVLRACAMAACGMLAVHLGRPATGRRLLLLAATTLLAIDPFLLHSVGFLLSCGACAGITLLGPRLVATIPGPRWVREGLATTAAAQLGVAPVLLPVFDTLPLIALPANLLAVPLAGPLTVWGLAVGVVGGALLDVAPGLVAMLQLPTRVLADAMTGLAAAASRVPLALDGRAAVALLVPAALAALGAVVVKRRRMLRRHALVVPPR